MPADENFANAFDFESLTSQRFFSFRRLRVLEAQEPEGAPLRVAVLRQPFRPAGVSMKGKGFIVAAQDVLRTPSGSQRDCLDAAAALFWKAMFYEEAWPDDLRVRASEIARSLLAYGPIKATISTMDDSEIGRAVDEL